MRGGQRPGAGRKPRPDNKMIRVSISLTPEEYDWLKGRPDGMGRVIRQLIDAELKRHVLSCQA